MINNDKQYRDMERERRKINFLAIRAPCVYHQSSGETTLILRRQYKQQLYNYCLSGPRTVITRSHPTLGTDPRSQLARNPALFNPRVPG
mgnify:CR=1 FL=1